VGVTVDIAPAAPPAEQLAQLREGVQAEFARCREQVEASRKAEEALRASEARFSALANNIAQLAWMADKTGYIFWYNKRWYEYTGTKPEQMEGWGWQRVHDPAVLPRVLEEWTKSIATGEPFDMEFPLRGADGDFRPFLTRVFPVKDNDGRVVYWFGTNTDVSEIRKTQDTLLELTATLEQRIRERTAALEATNKELEAFSYSVSHDLRAPLRGIDGFSKMLLEKYAGQIDAAGQEYLRRVRNATLRMNRLIEDMLKLSRIGRTEMRREPIDVSELAAAVIADLRACDPDRRMQVDIQPDLHVTGDAGLLRIALENLLGNAWKFTGKTADAHIAVGMTEQGARVFYVRDNGAGFDMSYADKLFSPFQRLHGEDEFPGTGIGLAIVQRIIARHGGRVWAEGHEGQGATIYFTLGDGAC
jgi:PAS domain S-box-containing protein